MSNTKVLAITPSPLAWLAVLLLWLWPQPAMAHVESGQAGGFLDGVHHPISGLDHVLAMVAVGLWGAQLGSPAVWLLPVAFPMMMAFGGMLGLMGCSGSRCRDRNCRLGRHPGRRHGVG